MPRIRSVHPDICTDDALAELDDAEAERLFVRLWTHLDDDGRCVDNPRLLKAALFPLQDRLTPEMVNDILATLDAAGLVIRYEHDGRRYLTAKPGPWSRWQKPRRHVPSKLPAPPDTDTRCADNVGTRADDGAQRPTGGGGVDGVGDGDVDGGEGESEGEGAATERRPQPVHGLERAAHEAGQRMKLVPPAPGAA